MRFGTHALALAFVAVGIVAGLVGCSSGGGATPDPTPTPDETRFRPNYADQFTSRRRWPKTSFKIFVDRGDETRSLTTLKGIVTQGVKLWQTAIDSRLTFTFVSSTSDADINVKFVRQIMEDGAPAGPKVVGLTTVSFSFSAPQTAKTGTIKAASVQIQTGLTEPILLKDITHELGHSLGIEGHSLDSDDVMFAFAEPPTVITQRDQNTLGLLYYVDWRSQPVPLVSTNSPVFTGTATVACPIR